MDFKPEAVGSSINSPTSTSLFDVISATLVDGPVRTLRSTPGRSRRYCCSSGGSKYAAAVLLDPPASLPPAPERTSSSACSASESRRSISCAYFNSSCPAEVSTIERPSLSKRRECVSTSRAAICRVTADWVNDSWSAALVKLPSRATLTRAASCLNSIKTNYSILEC